MAIAKSDDNLTRPAAIYEASRTVNRFEKERGRIDWFEVNGMLKEGIDFDGVKVSDVGKGRTRPRPLRLGPKSKAMIEKIQHQTAVDTRFNWSPNRKSRGVTTSRAITLAMVIYNLDVEGNSHKVPFVLD